jgi:Protein of unknown function (DUF4240)
MTNTLRYPLRNISPEKIQDLQEKYPNASVRIELSDEPSEGGLSEDAFWNLIGLFDWSQTGNDEAVIAPAVSALAGHPLRHIYDFKDILSQKLYLLDGVDFASHTGDNAYRVDREDFNAELFLYARCAVVANGKLVFEEVLKHPDRMPVNVDFEAILWVANEAHRRQKGTSLRYVSAYSVETFSNEKGWQF